MSVHDEWDRQRDIEAEGQRAGREPIRIEKSLFADAPFTIGSVPLEAVPLLLAVAKAAYQEHMNPSSFCMVCRVLGDLETAHPGWHEWA